MVHLSRAAILSCFFLIAMQVYAHGEALPPTYPICNLMERIDEARQLLESSPRLRYEERNLNTKVKVVTRKVHKKGRTTGVTRKELSRQEIALAVLDMNTGRIFKANYWLNTDDIARANRLRATGETDPGIPRFHPYESSTDLEVVVNRWNTYNSDLSLKNKGQDNTAWYVVVANKYLVPSSRLTCPTTRESGRYTDIVYVPYSRALHSDSLIDAGKTFLSEQVARAFADLKKRQVMSRAYAGQLVADTISERFIRHLLINEHSDPRMMLAADDKGRQVAERFIILMAANGQQAFRFSSSSTGAIGIAQIMPKTYDYVVVKYPDAELIRNTDRGRSEIENAIKASILVCDDLMATVVRKLGNPSPLHQACNRRLFDEKSEDEIDEIRAAIYNGGPGKYLRKTGSICPRVSETVYFVRKLGLIRDLNLFEGNPDDPKIQLEKSIGLQSQSTQN